MSNEKVLFTKGNYRIVEKPDPDVCLERLKGDCFNVEVNPDMSVEKLKEEEREFEKRVECEGVFGYELQIWDGEVGIGWTHKDSCWGFVGCYEDEKHDIVQEMRDIVDELTSRKAS